MKNKQPENQNNFEPIPLRLHPRVFSALGTDLITNDVVAVIELVKNSYDAFANNVWLRFQKDQERGMYLEIEDDGTGMTEEIIRNVWCLVATPYKEQNPESRKDDKIRRVVGEKGLGRLSASRLGDELQILTQASKSKCLELKVNWTNISNSDDISSSCVHFREYPDKSPFSKSGTILRIYNLKTEWDEDRLADLEDNLARLISPFSQLGQFNIYLDGPEDKKDEEVKIEAPEFLSKPKYSIKGEVTVAGNIQGTYKFNPLHDNGKRSEPVNLSWDQINDLIEGRTEKRFEEKGPHCGSFSFEIRAWDIDSEGTEEISDKFNIQKSKIRKAIRSHKGISIYRDDILVLPKSDKSRDWLGLDLRRVSKVGTRLSTSQIVGYVSISADENPKIEDTSDRERLGSCLEVEEFEEILVTIISLLENRRDSDREKKTQEKPMDDLFENLSAEELVAEVISLAGENADAAEAVPLLQVFSKKLDETRRTIQSRFVYYSRLATIGTIAQMLVHEIRNRTSIFGEFLKSIEKMFTPFKEKNLEKEYNSSNNAVNALEKLADTFAPLASRSFKRKKRSSILEKQIKDCIDLHHGEIKRKKIKYSIPNTTTKVAVDPGELDTILINLISNAVYWLGEVPQEDRNIEIKLSSIMDNTRVRIWVHDTGPGIKKEDVEKIFWPGITRKPNGIGMGLTVASELVSGYGGRMVTKYPGTKGGASFAFDLPIKI